MDRLEQALWDRPSVDLLGLKGKLQPTLEAPVGVLSRVPMGLAWAKAIDLVVELPSGFTALAPGSRWASCGRSLAVVAEPDGVEDILRDLAACASWSDALQTQLPAALRAALVAGSQDPSHRVGLAAHLGLQLETLEQWGEPGFRQVAAWASEVWQPSIRVQPELRPTFSARQGFALGKALGQQLDSPFGVVASDTPLLFEPLSPYARDLELALLQWLRERGEPWTTHLPSGASRTEVAQVASMLLFQEAADEVRQERRAAEASQGLHLEDHRLATVGRADLWKLDRPDPSLGDLHQHGCLALLYSPNQHALSAAVEGFREVWPHVDVAVVASASVDGLTVPDAVHTEADGYVLPSANTVKASADRLEIAYSDPQAFRLDLDHWAVRVAGQVRRDAVVGRCPPELCLQLALYPHDLATVEAFCAGLHAVRVVLSSALPEVGNASNVHVVDPPLRVSTTKNRPHVRRFRV